MSGKMVTVMIMQIKKRLMKREVNMEELAKRIIDCISDGYDDEENREETEDLLYDSLSQLNNDSPIKVALIRLCETIEELQE